MVDSWAGVGEEGGGIEGVDMFGCGGGRENVLRFDYANGCMTL